MAAASSTDTTTHTAASEAAASCCSGCQTSFSLFRRKHLCPVDRGGCGQALCSSCLSYAVLTEEEAKKKGSKGVISTLCKSCFIKHSVLDFTVTEDVLGPSAGEAPTVVYVHGGGGCRAMFRDHAKAMAAKGMRCVLLDLPGHGSRLGQPLTTATAIQTIADTINKHAPPCRGVKPIYIGGSLGGYLGMEFLGQHPDLVSAAVILMAGQTVGVGRGLAARVGLVMMKSMMGAVSQATVLNALVGEARKNGHISDSALHDIALRTGMFFGQGAAQIAILQATDPVKALPAFQGPILFINGSKDHHDGQDKWLAAVPNKSSKLLVYEGGDHFFSHDSRFAPRLVDDTWAFIEPLLNASTDTPASSTAST